MGKRLRKAFSCCALAKPPAALLTVGLLIGCNVELPGKPNPAKRPVPQNEISDFAKLFAQNCSGCHGAKGELGPAPPLNDPLFLALIPYDALQRAIREGRPGTPMPAFGHAQGGTLTDEQVDIIAAGLRSHWNSADDAGETKSNDDDAKLAEEAPPYLSPRTANLQLSPASAERGAELFARACAECHGPDGIGGETGYASGGAINDRAFLALISDQALRRIIITGRADLGMPNFAATDGRPDDYQPLTSEEIDDLVALLASWRAGANAPSAEAGN